ncbi:MAG: DUF1214 domain-containing protein [Pseudomonadota bacterium]
MTDPAESASPATTAPAPRERVWRRRWFPYLVLPVVGLLLGFGLAVRTVRAGALSSGERIGAWETGRDFGSADASAKTRAVVALRGLLALPASEARYYSASVDDGGAPLTGNCTYRLTGGVLPAAWWSVTFYDRAGYLVANPANSWSVGSAALSPTEQNRWTILVSPDPQPGRWLPTGGTAEAFVLTLRAYLPADGGKGNFTAAELPTVRKEGCK